MRKSGQASRWEKVVDAVGFGRREKRSRILKARGGSLLVEPLEERQLLTVLYWDPNHTGGTALGGTGNWMGAAIGGTDRATCHGQAAATPFFKSRETARLVR